MKRDLFSHAAPVEVPYVKPVKPVQSDAHVRATLDHGYFKAALCGAVPWLLANAAAPVSRESEIATADGLHSTPFIEIELLWASGEMAAPVFVRYCEKARKHGPGPWGAGSPDWTRYPCCVWELCQATATPNDVRELERRGAISHDVMDDYKQVWRRSAWRDSTLWIETDREPLRPRAAEALAMIQNPERRAPIDRSLAAAFEHRHYTSLYGVR